MEAVCTNSAASQGKILHLSDYVCPRESAVGEYQRVTFQWEVTPAAWTRSELYRRPARRLPLRARAVGALRRRLSVLGETLARRLTEKGALANCLEAAACIAVLAAAVSVWIRFTV